MALLFHFLAVIEEMFSVHIKGFEIFLPKKHENV